MRTSHRGWRQRDAASSLEDKSLLRCRPSGSSPLGWTWKRVTLFCPRDLALIYTPCSGEFTGRRIQCRPVRVHPPPTRSHPPVVYLFAGAIHIYAAKGILSKPEADNDGNQSEERRSTTRQIKNFHPPWQMLNEDYCPALLMYSFISISGNLHL